jgi:uncharacterized protein YycO
MSVKFRFVRGTNLVSDIIALAGAEAETMGFSHVDIVLPSGELLGARSDEVGGKPPGVQVRPAGYTGTERFEVFELPATPTQESAFYAYALEQVGKPYDKLAILAFVLGRNWRDEGHWFCSELGAAATEKAGLCDELYLPANKIMPTTWAVVLSALGGVRQ